MTFKAIEKYLEMIPHPILLGCVAIALGILVVGLASPFKSKADRWRTSKSPDRRRKATWLNWGFILFLIFGAFLTGLGTWLTIVGTRGDAALQVKAAQDLLNQTRKDNEAARKEFDSKLQTVLAALNAAKLEQTVMLTEEKIKGIRTNFLQWAEDFASRKPDKQRQFEQAKIAERQKEIQISSESMPLFLFTIKFVKEAISAYASKVGGTGIQTDVSPLPENLYSSSSRSAGFVEFGPTGRWDFHVNSSLPASEDNPPMFQVRLVSSESRIGWINIWKAPNTAKFNVSGSGSLPLSNATALFGAFDMNDYEDTIRRIFQRLIEGQLVDVPLPTPSPSPTPSTTPQSAE